MKVIEKIKEKALNMSGKPSVTIAFLGDSVTQGCFECYKTGETSLQTVFDYKSGYAYRFREILNMLYPNAQINIINAGISGDTANGGAARFDRDIARFSPDLVVVSYGLNDCVCGGEAGKEPYAAALLEIFEKVRSIGAEGIFLTQNYMCKSVSCHLKEDVLRQSAESCAIPQKSGLLEEYFTAAKAECDSFGVRVCDVRKAWKKMDENGVDVTELLANKSNHPTREMHYYMAIKLVETLFDLD